MSRPFRSARLTATGWEESLCMESGVVPEPGPGQVRVRVEACGVCHRDLIDREGRFPFLQLPITPGHEAVGFVDAVGAGVDRWQEGDRVGTLHRDHCGTCDRCRADETCFCEGAAWVFGLLADGGYASHLLAPEAAPFAMDGEIPAVEAAVLHCAAGSAWRGLVTVGEIGPSDRVLVTGANGGVGAIGVQVAAQMGAHVTALVRNPAQVEFVEGLGADVVVVNDTGDFHKDPAVSPVDLVLEAVGAPTFNASLRSLRTGGRMSVVGNVTTERVPLNLGQLVVRGIRVSGPGGATPDDAAALTRAYREGVFRVPVHAEFPLEEADQAMRLVRSGGLRGRVVLSME